MTRRSILSGLAVLALGGCGDGGTVGPPADDLRALALAAGLEAMPATPAYPVDNPAGADKVELGHLLFFDPVLSGPRDVACSTCHLPRFAFTDGRQFSVGAGGSGLGPDRTLPAPPLRPMPRNTPVSLNMGLFGHMDPEPSVNGTMFWGGSSFGIEQQVLNPISADKELRGLTYPKTDALDSVIARIRGIPGYVARFGAAFPAEASTAASPPDVVTTTTLRRALAAYLRELVTDRSPYDAYLAGDDAALTDPQKAGLRLFIGKAGCVACHTGPLLSDFSMHVLGTAQDGMGRDTTPGDDMGWGEVGGVPYAFRTPQLREVELTGPYFHAGTAATLESVLRFKNAGVSENPNVPDADLDPQVRPLGLSDGEIASLVAFLRALTDTVSFRQPLFLAPDSVPSNLQVPR